MTFGIAADPSASYGTPSYQEPSPFFGYYQPAREDYVSRFSRLLRRWRIATLTSSRLEEKIQHQAFQEIVEIGDPAVPLIISELKRQPDFLFVALHQITGEDPISPSDIGYPDRMVEAWLRWAERDGIDAD